MMVSIGEARWRILRKLLRFKKKPASFTQLRSYCRYDKDVNHFATLVRGGLIEEVRSHTGRKKEEEGHYLITEKGKVVADLGEVSLDELNKMDGKAKPNLKLAEIA